MRHWSCSGFAPRGLASRQSSPSVVPPQSRPSRIFRGPNPTSSRTRLTVREPFSAGISTVTEALAPIAAGAQFSAQSTRFAAVQQESAAGETACLHRLPLSMFCALGPSVRPLMVERAMRVQLFNSESASLRCND
mmetsp:Transcript_103830/g.334701  ORF Transcript_103830/g.334701 Transcript_103830/m.334701 type:complete len:135 (+) Transcript_103830:175-579(+)